MPIANQNKRKLSSFEVELIYAKSKVCLHPSKAKKDNIPGFLILIRGANCTNKDIVLAFIPESRLTSQELKIYEKVDLECASRDKSLYDSASEKTYEIISKPSFSLLSGYSFGVPLSYVYSIQLRTPSSGFWHGSIIIHAKDGEKFPILFFHDDESPSTKARQKIRNLQFETFNEDGELYWGGNDFLSELESLVHLERSTIERSVYLVNPDSTDLRQFSPFVTDQSKKKLQNKEEPFKVPNFNKMFANAKWKVLETVATISARTKNQVVDLVTEHAPDTVKNAMKNPEFQKVDEEFDSLHIYLAKWAQKVKDEAEKSRSQYILHDDVYERINNELGSTELLTEEEINKASRRKEISKAEWDTFFDYTGRLSITVNEVKERIFHGGLESSIRKEAWLFLLEVYPWDSSSEERKLLKESYITSYAEFKMRWLNDDHKRHTSFWKDQKHRIEKDVARTDRNLDLFKNNKKKGSVSGDTEGSRSSSPETPDEDEESDGDFDVSNINNPHLFALREILLTYNEYNVNLGYIQGMTDLLSPLYVVLQDEQLTFWAFVNFMNRMERNFVRDQSGMKQQMSTLNKLVQFMLPNMYKHLEKCESIDLFFFFRMLLVWYKRELPWDNVLRLWEILWTDYYSSQYHLFIALSILSDNERIVIQNLKRFDEVLKYFNDLSLKLNLDLILIRSELLFLKFKRMIDIIDRENSILRSNNTNSTESTGLVAIGDDVRGLLSKKIVIQKEVKRPEGAGGG